MAEGRRRSGEGKAVRCAIYTRKSSEEGLELGFNSLHAQREACEAYILSQRQEGWIVIREAYDDGGYSGGSMERPALKGLLNDVDAGKVDVIVVYKIDRLTRSLLDFARIVEILDRRNVSFVSVTQQFNTTTSMGRLTLNVLLSFAQFEREVTGERIRDKIAASKKKGMWMGGLVPLGYEAADRRLVINPKEAETIRAIFDLYLKLKSVRLLEAELRRRGLTTKRRNELSDHNRGGRPFSRGHLYRILSNPLYVGEIAHRGMRHPGQHPAIVSREVFDAVQAQLKENGREHRVRAGAASVSLLAGLLFDEAGNRFTPTHVGKGSRRYRYYALNRGERQSSEVRPKTIRFAAADLERVIIGKLIDHLRNQAWIVAALGNQRASRLQEVMQHAAGLADRLRDDSQSERRATLTSIVERIVLTDGQCDVALRTETLSGNAVPEAPDDPSVLWIRLVAPRPRGDSNAMQVNDQPAQAQLGLSNTAMVKSIARGHVWFEDLVSGRAKSIKEIAAREGVSDRYVVRLMEGAFLEPSAVRLAVEGQPPRPTKRQRRPRL